MSSCTVVLVVPTTQLKSLKTAVEQARSANTVKPIICPHPSRQGFSRLTLVVKHGLEAVESTTTDSDQTVLRFLGLAALGLDVRVEEIRQTHPPNDVPRSVQKPIETILAAWLDEVEQSGAAKQKTAEITALREALAPSTWPTRFIIYQPMLLFSSGAFEGGYWQRLFDYAGPERCTKLWHSIATQMQVTHIAVNAPIHKHNPDTTKEQYNILRLPSHLRPLYGDFGPEVISRRPTKHDYEQAFWVQAAQNGIKQCWAPRYTMFSRGNIKEKARILAMPSVCGAVSVEQRPAVPGRLKQKSCAVDLFAGIGYFAFSYAKAGVDKVLCWELNPWSIEGLIRGASANNWTSHVYGEDKPGAVAELVEAAKDDRVRFLVFNHSNVMAQEMLEHVRNKLPPIRHVNCGLLPTAEESCEDAVRMIDTALGGWIHLHANMATVEIARESQRILKDVQGFLDKKIEALKGSSSIQVTAPARVILDHVERVKSYAPGVMHCVLDFAIPPIVTPT